MDPNKEWHANGPVWHPPYGQMCEIRLYTGEVYEAEIKTFNEKYHSKHLIPDRWRRPGPGLTKKERWIDDDLVAEWRPI